MDTLKSHRGHEPAMGCAVGEEQEKDLMETLARMKRLPVKKYLARALLVAVCLGGAGCSSLQVRRTKQYQSLPHVYPATRDRDKLGFPRPIAAYIGGLEDSVKFDPWLGMPCEFHPESCLFGGIAYVIGGVFYVAVDRPVAIVTDTVLFPYDRYRVHQYDAVTQFWQHSFMHEGALPLPSCSDMREHNYPPYVDSALSEYLNRVNVSRPLLVKLVRVGVGNRLIAASSHLDIDLCHLLLSTSDDMTNVCVALSRNTSAPPTALEGVLERCDESAVLRNLASNTNATPRLFDRLSSYGEAQPRVLQALARNTSVPDRLLSELPALYDYGVTRNTAASLGTLERIVKRSPEALSMLGVVKHPATTGELLGSIVEQFPENREVGRAVVARTKVPEDVLWALARNGAVNNALARRTDLPASILSHMAENASWPVQRILVRREDLSVKAQRSLARGDNADARQSLVLNPTVAPQILHEMACNEVDSVVLLYMAGLTNAPESVYLALAAKHDRKVRMCLACNSAVTDAVLRELLKNADEHTARLVLRNQRASLRTKQAARDVIAGKAPDDRKERPRRESKVEVLEDQSPHGDKHGTPNRAIRP